MDAQVTEVPGPGTGKVRLPTGQKNTDASPLPLSHLREEVPSKAWSPFYILLQSRNKMLDATLVARRQTAFPGATAQLQKYLVLSFLNYCFKKNNSFFHS